MQLDNDPVTSPRPEPTTTPLCLPPVPHVLAPSRKEKVSTRTKMLVAHTRDGCATENVSEVDGLVRGARDGDDLAVRSEASDSSIGVHGEFEVGDWCGGRVEAEQVTRGGAKGPEGHQAGPQRTVVRDRLADGSTSTPDVARRALIPTEAARIDVHAVDAALRSELYNDPVVRRVVPPTLPAIEECTLWAKLALHADRGLRT